MEHDLWHQGVIVQGAHTFHIWYILFNLRWQFAFFSTKEAGHVQSYNEQTIVCCKCYSSVCGMGVLYNSLFLSGTLYHMNQRLISAPVNKNTVFAFLSNYMQTTLFHLERFLKKLAKLPMLFHKGSIYHIKHYVHKPFTTVMDWPEIWCLMDVSTIINIWQILNFLLSTADIIIA